MFDTHCHLNFKRFAGKEREVIDRAFKVGVKGIIIPGTDIKSSFKALELAKLYDGIYAAVGIHPHHALDANHQTNILEIGKLLQEKKVVAVGEVGIDKFEYKNTKYADYRINEAFITKQKELLLIQTKLAIKYNKSLILHNRETKTEIVMLLSDYWDKKLEYHTVLHCCEPDRELLDFAKQHHIFVGVDGDVTYDRGKADFVKTIPLEMLVLETDSPYLLPEPLRSQNKYPNEPCNIPIILSFIAKLKNIQEEEVKKITSYNAHMLFNLPEHKA